MRDMVTLTVTGDGDRSGLHRAIWESSRRFLDPYVAPLLEYMAPDYVDGSIEDCIADGTWGVHGDELRWRFDDIRGGFAHSASLWAHWLTLALAADGDRVRDVAADHDLMITSPALDLSAVLADSPRFVTAAGVRVDRRLVPGPDE